jgi:pimeloyl-ACP methyl ester carboxylesterase
VSDPRFLTTAQGRQIAYHLTGGTGPTVVFLGGLRSDMQGTKAVFLQDWAETRGQAFLRFDYSGHGQSSGSFEAGCIGDWAQDAAAAIETLTDGPLVLVGSSMGGWVSLLMARQMPQRIAGLVTIAAAPDFTEDSMWAAFSVQQKAELVNTGQIALPSDYDTPLIVTRRMIEDGRKQLVLRHPLRLPFPTRMLQGTADMDVDMSVALRLLAHVDGDDIRLALVKGADHRFSEPETLRMIIAALEDVLKGGAS